MEEKFYQKKKEDVKGKGNHKILKGPMFFYYHKYKRKKKDKGKESSYLVIVPFIVYKHTDIASDKRIKKRII